jgi:hypothetical protein
MAWVRLVKRSECFEETDYVFDVATGRRYVPSPDIDARSVPWNTTTDVWRTVFLYPPTKPRQCVRHDQQREG